MEVGHSLPPLQRAGSTREQGLHAKDSKIQNKPEQSNKKVARKGTSTVTKWMQEAKEIRSLYRIPAISCNTSWPNVVILHFICEYAAYTNTQAEAWICEWGWFYELQFFFFFFCEWGAGCTRCCKHESRRSSHGETERNRFHLFHQWVLGGGQIHVTKIKKDYWRQAEMFPPTYIHSIHLLIAK